MNALEERADGCKIVAVECVGRLPAGLSLQVLTQTVR